MKLPRPRRWVLVAGLMGLMLGVIWWCWRQAFPPAVRFANGNIGIVRAVTYGTNHVFVDGPLWIRMVGRYLPRPLSARRGLLRHSLASAAPSTVVWMEWQVQPETRMARLAAVVDRHGIVSEPKPTAVSALAVSNGVFAWQLANYPRRERNLRLRFYDDNAQTSESSGELMLPNPAPRAGHWNAPAAPVSVSDGGVTFTLLSLNAGAVGPTNSTTNASRALHSLAAFQVVEAGRTDAVWSVRALEGRGASGNWFKTAWLPSPETPLLIGFREVLWPDEPDWRLRVEFARTAGYQAQDLFTLKSVNAVITNPPFTTNLQLSLRGVELKSVDLRGTRQIRRWVRGAYRPNSDLALEFARPPGMQVELVRIADDQGREVRFGHIARVSPTRLEAGVELLRDSQTVDLTLAVHQSRLAEFLVRPDWSTSRWAAAVSSFSLSVETITKGAR